VNRLAMSVAFRMLLAVGMMGMLVMGMWLAALWMAGMPSSGGFEMNLGAALFTPIVASIFAMKRGEGWAHHLHAIRFVIVVMPFLILAAVLLPESADAVSAATVAVSSCVALFATGYLLEALERRNQRLAVGNTSTTLGSRHR